MNKDDVRYSSAPTRVDRCAAVVMDTFTREYIFYRQCRNKPMSGSRICKVHFETSQKVPYYRSDPLGEPDDNLEDHKGQEALLRLKGQMGFRFSDPDARLRKEIRDLERELDNREHEIRGLKDRTADQEEAIQRLARSRDRSRAEVERLKALEQELQEQVNDAIDDQVALRRAQSTLRQCREELSEKEERLGKAYEMIEEVQREQRQYIEAGAQLETEYNRVRSKLNECRQLVPEDAYF